MIRKRKHRKPAPKRATKPLPPQPSAPPPLSPDQIVRFKDGPIYFGAKLTQLSVFIERGEIPTPLYLSDTGRVRGWRGSVILEWQAQRAEKTAEKIAAAKTQKERPRSFSNENDEEAKMTT